MPSPSISVLLPARNAEATVVTAARCVLQQTFGDLELVAVDDGSTDGTGSLLRSLDRYLDEQTGLPTRVMTDPITAVARGTHICLAHFDRWRTAMRSTQPVV